MPALKFHSGPRRVTAFGEDTLELFLLWLVAREGAILSFWMAVRGTGSN